MFNILEKYRDYRKYRHTIFELSKLSNRELSDLGISRADIPRIAREVRS